MTITPTSTTFEDFVSSVKFVLTTSHATPESVADELLQADANYLRATWEKEQEHPGTTSILDVAAEIALLPGDSAALLEEGNGSVVIRLRPAVLEAVEALVKRGIHGESIKDVLEALIVRGIESASVLLPNGKFRYE